MPKLKICGRHCKRLIVYPLGVAITCCASSQTFHKQYCKNFLSLSFKKYYRLLNESQIVNNTFIMFFFAQKYLDALLSISIGPYKECKAKNFLVIILENRTTVETADQRCKLPINNVGSTMQPSPQARSSICTPSETAIFILTIDVYQHWQGWPGRCAIIRLDTWKIGTNEAGLGGHEDPKKVYIVFLKSQLYVNNHQHISFLKMRLQSLLRHYMQVEYFVVLARPMVVPNSFKLCIGHAPELRSRPQKTSKCPLALVH